MNFVFDVDGTLTPSRGKIDPYFEQFFEDFCKRNVVYLVTGSDYAKTVDQLGLAICHDVAGVFNCSGNLFIEKGIMQYANDFYASHALSEALNEELRKSGFSVRTGNHVEQRIGAINFSIVGRNANAEQRQQYVVWDNATNERATIRKRLSNMFPNMEFVTGGETGIDILQKGNNKAQVRNHIEGKIIFFGDKCEPGGNDYPLAKIADVVYNVKDWQETEYILRMKYGKAHNGE